MIPETLRNYLDSHLVRYHVHTHDLRFTAQETAQVAHVSGKQFAKVVLLEVHDGKPPSRALAVLPANEKVDLDRLGRAIGCPVMLASEEVYEDIFPDCEVGAAPPIGDLAKGRIRVFVDACLARGDAIAFNGGTHTDVVEMPWRDYDRITDARVIDYGRPVVAPPPLARNED